jgi:hypothetical protein
MLQKTFCCDTITLKRIGGVLCRDVALTQFSLLPMKKSIWKMLRVNIRHRIVMLCAQKSFYSPLRGLKTKRSANALTCRGKSSANGANVFMRNGLPVWMTDQDAADRALFPPEVTVAVKAIACELPDKLGVPFSRLSNADIAREVVQRGFVASISNTTVWRWLSADAIKPWTYRSWIFPRDPQFREKAGRVLDLYHGVWDEVPLGPDDYVLSADEKTSIQARQRCHAQKAPLPHQNRLVEFEYKRHGALAYLAAWDVHRAKVFGQCDSASGIEAYHRLVDHVMRQEPYRSARRVFWITDNGSSHRGEPSVLRLSQWYPNAIQVHTPVHASWLNQIEIYFSIVQRKVLVPNDFPNLRALETRILEFQSLYEQCAKPFEWKFTTDDLKRTLTELDLRNTKVQLVA